jgi:hypothetical protein
MIILKHASYPFGRVFHPAGLEVVPAAIMVIITLAIIIISTMIIAGRLGARPMYLEAETGSK